jgi:hypothetical protein
MIVYKVFCKDHELKKDDLIGVLTEKKEWPKRGDPVWIWIEMGEVLFYRPGKGKTNDLRGA